MTTLAPKAVNAAKETFGDALSWGADPQDALYLALNAFADALSSPKQYTCPICKSHDASQYLTCNRPDCTDGRDPR